MNGENCEPNEIYDLNSVQFQYYPNTNTTEDLYTAYNNIDGEPYCKSNMTYDENNNTDIYHHYYYTNTNYNATRSYISYYALDVDIYLQN
jgi:hypothetical protein